MKQGSKGHTKYKYVYKVTRGNKVKYYGSVRRRVGSKYKNLFVVCNTIREAALAVDKFLIRLGLDPINILKKV